MILASFFSRGLIASMQITNPNQRTAVNLGHDEPMAANKAAVRRLYEECINQGKMEIADELIGSEFTVPGPDGGHGPAGFKANLSRLRTGFPDVHFTIHDLLAEGDGVAVYWTWEATHRGPFAGILATNKSVHQEGMVMYRFRAGKAVAAKVIFDRLGVFQQLGRMPALPSNPENSGRQRNDEK